MGQPPPAVAGRIFLSKKTYNQIFALQPLIARFHQKIFYLSFRIHNSSIGLSPWFTTLAW